MSVSKFVMIVSWISIFMLTWMGILKYIPINGVFWTSFIFFCITALFSALFNAGDNRPKE